MTGGVKATDLTALVCSRLCHDLVSPVGALANGLEIMAEEDDPDTMRQAVELLNHSVTQAASKLQFFRLAFGASASAGQSVATDEIVRTIRGYLDDRNIGFDWPETPVEIDKTTVRILANMVIVASECVVREGRVSVKNPADVTLQVAVEGKGCALRPEWAAALDGEVDMAAPGAAPALLLAMLMAEAGGTLTTDAGAERIVMSARF